MFSIPRFVVAGLAGQTCSQKLPPPGLRHLCKIIRAVQAAIAAALTPLEVVGFGEHHIALGIDIIMHPFYPFQFHFLTHGCRLLRLFHFPDPGDEGFVFGHIRLLQHVKTDVKYFTAAGNIQAFIMGFNL